MATQTFLMKSGARALGYRRIGNSPVTGMEIWSRPGSLNLKLSQRAGLWIDENGLWRRATERERFELYRRGEHVYMMGSLPPTLRTDPFPVPRIISINDYGKEAA